MIEVQAYRDKSVAVLGLGRSGISAARALSAGGAHVLLWDDDSSKRTTEDASAFAFADLNEAKFEEIDTLVLSPGIPLTHPRPHPVVQRAQEAGCPVVGDVELFARTVAGASVVGITGTNGKSTTTALIGHVLASCGRDVAVGGNLGTPVLDLPQLSENGIYVLELSSFQIDLTPSLACDVAVLLNLSPDHLDRHGDMAGYVAVKQRLLTQQTAAGTAVIGLDDQESEAIFERIEATRSRRVIPVRVGQPIEDGIYVIDGVLYDAIGEGGHPPCDLRNIGTLLGAHNWQNAAAAIAVVRALGIGNAEACAALPSFPGLPHRLEQIATIDGVRFVNDSKATNASAAARALATFENIHWIAGGIAKAGGIKSLADYHPNIAHAYLIGEAADEFAATLANRVEHTVCGTLDRAVACAWERCRTAPAGEPVVLLSPACASFDQWSSFEARGDGFRRLVAALADETLVTNRGARC